jgi:hypothetical protein
MPAARQRSTRACAASARRDLGVDLEAAAGGGTSGRREARRERSAESIPSCVAP